MIAIHEIQQMLWVETPHGDGLAVMVMDYGPQSNTVWVVALEKDGVIKHYDSNDVRLCYNHTFGINSKKPSNNSAQTQDATEE